MHLPLSAWKWLLLRSVMLTQSVMGCSQNSLSVPWMFVHVLCWDQWKWKKLYSTWKSIEFILISLTRGRFSFFSFSFFSFHGLFLQLSSRLIILENVVSFLNNAGGAKINLKKYHFSLQKFWFRQYTFIQSLCTWPNISSMLLILLTLQHFVYPGHAAAV